MSVMKHLGKGKEEEKMDSIDEEQEYNGTPAELNEIANKLREDLLPTKSRETYQKVFDTFQKWKKKVKVITENVVLAYFSELSKKYQPPTLWSTYSMLRSTLNINEKINLEDFKQLIAFLKRQSSGYQSKKSKTFSAEEMKQFLETAPDEQYLATKVALIFGVCAACRGAELINLTVDDVRKFDDVMIVKLKDTKNKTDRNFTIEGKFFKIFERYTGQSFRRSSAILCADKGADITEIKRLGGWKSTAIAEGYIEDSVGHKRKMGKQISNAIAMSSTSFESLSFEQLTKRQKLEKDDHEKNIESLTHR